MAGDPRSTLEEVIPSSMQNVRQQDRPGKRGRQLLLKALGRATRGRRIGAQLGDQLRYALTVETRERPAVQHAVEHEIHQLVTSRGQRHPGAFTAPAQHRDLDWARAQALPSTAVHECGRDGDAQALLRGAIPVRRPGSLGLEA
jgi:hypothetical protein